MSVHVDEMTSDVVGEPAPSTTPSSGTTPWEEEERARAVAERVARDAERTRAEGFDD